MSNRFGKVGAIMKSKSCCLPLFLHRDSIRDRDASCAVTMSIEVEIGQRSKRMNSR